MEEDGGAGESTMARDMGVRPQNRLVRSFGGRIELKGAASVEKRVLLSEKVNKRARHRPKGRRARVNEKMERDRLERNLLDRRRRSWKTEKEN